VVHVERAAIAAGRHRHAAGNLVLDAQIAAVCLEHGASAIPTEDRDFNRFPGLVVRTLET
jgi:predicted nucleic acid-binding protein